jgi:hypothetical protein
LLAVSKSAMQAGQAFSPCARASGSPSGKRYAPLQQRCAARRATAP